jgi:hypothetical protein
MVKRRCAAAWLPSTRRSPSSGDTGISLPPEDSGRVKDAACRSRAMRARVSTRFYNCKSRNLLRAEGRVATVLHAGSCARGAKAVRGALQEAEDVLLAFLGEASPSRLRLIHSRRQPRGDAVPTLAKPRHRHEEPRRGGGALYGGARRHLWVLYQSLLEGRPTRGAPSRSRPARHRGRAHRGHWPNSGASSARMVQVLVIRPSLSCRQPSTSRAVLACPIALD